jgi:hypothetical protein
MSHPFAMKLTPKGASMDMKSYKALPEEYRPRAVAALKAAAVPYSPLKIRAAPAGVVSVRTVANPVRAPLKTIEPMARVEEDVLDDYGRPSPPMKKEEPEKFIWYENIKFGTPIVYGMGNPELGMYGVYNNTDTDFRRKRIVLEVMPDKRFLVGSLAYGDPRLVFKVNEAGDWLVDADGGPLKVYSIDGRLPTDPYFKRGAASRPKPAAKSAPPKKMISEVIRNIKVGDIIAYGQSSGYMGDGGDGRDVGYTVRRPVLKVLPRGKFEVGPEYTGNDPEVFKINEDGDWLVDTNRGRLQVYAIDGHGPPSDEEASARASARHAARFDKREAKRAAAVESKDFTKLSKAQLIAAIEAHTAKKGTRVRGLSTASKPKLIEFIREHKILE